MILFVLTCVLNKYSKAIDFYNSFICLLKLISNVIIVTFIMLKYAAGRIENKNFGNKGVQILDIHHS